jgi:DNA-binding transcriptional regulator YiaG
MSAVIQAHHNQWPEKLKAIRKKYGLTQVQAAERIGVTTRCWVAWENNQRTPSRITLRFLKENFPLDF